MKKNVDHPFYQLIDTEITRIDEKADKYRNSFYSMRIGLIVIAAIITILSGLNGNFLKKDCVLNLTLGLGTLITVMTSIETLFQIETKKNVYKLMLVELREIRSEIVYYSDNDNVKLDERIRTHLFPKYQTVMAYSKTLIEKKDKPQESSNSQNIQIPNN